MVVVSLEELSALMELRTPELAIARSGALGYLMGVQEQCRYALFGFRMPDKLEVKKYGSTVEFLRQLMDQCGFPLTDPRNPNPPPEIEALMEWLLSDRTLLAQNTSGQVTRRTPVHGLEILIAGGYQDE